MLVFPMKKLQRIAELYPADDDCVVLKTLIRNNNQEIDQQDRRMIKEFLFDNLNIFATLKFDVGKVSHDKLIVVINIGNKPVPCGKPYRLGKVRRKIMNNIFLEIIKLEMISTLI